VNSAVMAEVMKQMGSQSMLSAISGDMMEGVAAQGCSLLYVLCNLRICSVVLLREVLQEI